MSAACVLLTKHTRVIDGLPLLQGWSPVAGDRVPERYRNSCLVSRGSLTAPANGAPLIVFEKS
jgi:hypothetical protein